MVFAAAVSPVVSWTRRSQSVVAGVLAAAVLGEFTMTGPEPSMLDIVNTLMGGAVVLAALDRHGLGRRRSLVAAGALLVLTGLISRYVVQPSVKHWWWSPA